MGTSFVRALCIASDANQWHHEMLMAGQRDAWDDGKMSPLMTSLQPFVKIGHMKPIFMSLLTQYSVAAILPGLYSSS
jgi:hypothetical protein